MQQAAALHYGTIRDIETRRPTLQVIRSKNGNYSQNCVWCFFRQKTRLVRLDRDKLSSAALDKRQASSERSRCFGPLSIPSAFRSEELIRKLQQWRGLSGQYLLTTYHKHHP